LSVSACRSALICLPAPFIYLLQAGKLRKERTSNRNRHLRYPLSTLHFHRTGYLPDIMLYICPRKLYF
jgi:hypothetical protein